MAIGRTLRWTGQGRTGEGVEGNEGSRCRGLLARALYPRSPETTCTATVAVSASAAASKGAQGRAGTVGALCAWQRRDP